MKFFSSLCRIHTPSRPVSYTGDGVQIAEQEILIVVASLVHCCVIKNVIVASQLSDVADVQFTVAWTEGVESRGGRSHFFRRRIRSCSKIFESGSGNFFNLRIRLLIRLRLQSSIQPLFTYVFT